jgi:hypothetical protein
MLNVSIMDGISASSSNPLLSMIAMAASTSSGSGSPASVVSPAATLEMSTVQLQGQLLSTLLGSLPSASDGSSLFAGASALSLLNAQGTAALAYVAPPSQPLGQSINALA